jgi:two-component system invasion response regulator UvrY
MASGKIKILLADDHSVIRHGIIKSLTENFPEAEYFEASNAAEILQHLQKTRFNLIILDISMPGRNGLDILKDIKSNYPDIPVIIFSMYPEDQFAVRSIKEGASAYLTKDIPVAKLVDAIKRISKGEKYLTPSVVELITKELRNGHDKPLHETLSDREFQVFLLISSGKNVSAIAQELSLSVKTISVYRSIILKKMNLKNNAEITYYAFKNNLVE